MLMSEINITTTSRARLNNSLESLKCRILRKLHAERLLLGDVSTATNTRSL